MIIMDRTLKDKWFKVAKSAYAEYKLHAKDATEWELLTLGQKEGFAAATYHGLFVLNAIGSNKAFIL